MRVRKAALVLAAAVVGTALNSVQAIPFPGPLGNNENDNLMIFVANPLVSYNPIAGAGHPGDGVFNVTLDGGSFVEDNLSGNVLNDATFNLTAYINTSTAALDGGSLDIEGDFGLGDGHQVYFYSNTLDGFGGAGDTLEALFTQENAPVTGTDQTYVPLGGIVGVTIVAPVFSTSVPGTGAITDDLSTAYAPNDIGTLAKAYSTAGPVPEPVSMILIGMGLSALGLGVTRRASR